jgi:hypothetical protein
MNRPAYLGWAKSRAIDAVRAQGPELGWASLVSDLMKNPELADHPALRLGTLLLVNGHLSSEDEMIRFVEGFN